jgi:transposase
MKFLVKFLHKTGCQWRMFPKDFPIWVTVYSYFRIWNKKPVEDQPSLLETVLNKLVK